MSVSSLVTRSFFGGIAGLVTHGLESNAVSTVDTHDGFTDHDYKRHRKRLKAIANASDEYTRSKYVHTAINAHQITQELGLESPVIEALVASQTRNIELPYFDYEAFMSEVNTALAAVELKIRQKQERDAMEREDEMILMMILQ